MLLSCHDLACRRGELAVLQGVNFELFEGEALIFRGPNGIGKTTLLRTIAGLQPAMSGRVNMNPDEVVYAAHADALKASLTVVENLEFWANVYGGGPIAPAIEAFNLKGLEDRAAHNLSAGQKRRLGLSRLMVCGRKIWALDEPTVSLDAASVGLFAQAVKAHLAQGGAALIATHIDLGLEEARVLELGPFKAQFGADATGDAFDEAFL
ncbi:MAG: heme ABC exporter ATP-binding protein CcmA [Halocynthiibacter sp.]